MRFHTKQRAQPQAADENAAEPAGRVRSKAIVHTNVSSAENATEDGEGRALQRTLSDPVTAAIGRFGGEEPQGWGPQVA